ncbi:hypothetical protein FPV67DRAFT_1777134 [Lyophyllum atratum]|nr:hypothetical protein FPV67DRAFT_1777134 [Lyophyllum atratum]
MDGESADILGGPTFPNARDSQSGRWSGLSFGVKSAFATAVLLVLYVVAMRAWETFLVWRERAYKLSMRRRHGIPDNDHRPFNVAYAAVVRARQEGEAVARREKLQEMVQDQYNALPDQNVRQRQGIQRNAQTMRPNTIPGRYESADNFPSTSTNANYPYPSFAIHAEAEEHDRYAPVVRIAEPEVDDSPPKSGPSRRPIRKYINVSDDEGRKRGFNDDEFDTGPDHAKKTRVEDEEFVGGDEEPEWHERYDVRQRGSKRVFGDENDNEDAFLSAPRDKRQRKFSLDKSSQLVAEDMDIDEDEDDIGELRSSIRGRKRDRAEAGSTFGGDDDDSAHEAEEEDESKARRRHRKRRTYAKRKSDAGVSSRGQKRDRDLAGEGESEVEYDDGLTLKVSRKKRGKRSVSSEQDDRSDISMDESQVSASRGRPKQIGDEWESNGVKYKIGPNGQRLRQTLVKKARQKFNMPKDSQHPDRQANLEVCIETWLTEEEYREAKNQLLLAWQDSNKPSAEPETPSRESQDLPPVAGKDLLWKSTSAAPSVASSTSRQITPPSGSSQSSQMDRSLYSQSIASNVGLRLNPFQKQPVTSGKRIASAARVSSAFNGGTTHPGSAASPSPSLADSTNGTPRHKMYSKWEKQDLEAKAMMKMREANRKKEEEKAQKLREEKEKAEKLKKEQEAAAAPKFIPTITVTKPEDAKPAQAVSKPPTVSFAPPLDLKATPSTAPLAGPSGPQQQQPKAATPSFSFPAQPSQAAKPSGFPPSIPPLGGAPSQPANAFFGNKPDQQTTKPPLSFGFPPAPTPASSTPATSNPPSAKPSSASSATPSPFSFGAPSQPIQASQPAAKKEEPPASGTDGSLFSRPAPTISQPATQPTQTTSAFSFAKPNATESPKPTPFFGNLNAQNVPQTTTAQPPPAPTPATNTPKFNFGVSNKPASTTPSTTPAPATSTSSLSGALGTPQSKPAAPSPFGFNPPAPSSESAKTGAPAATGGATTTPKFDFGQSSSSTSAFGTSNPFAPKGPPASTTPAGTSSTTAPAPSPFGTSNVFAQSTTPAASTSSTPATQSPFAGFGGASGAPAAKPSPFGSSNVFGGGAANTFGGMTPAQTGEAPKPSPFGFGATSTPSTTTPAAAPPANKPSFSFGASGPTSASSSTAPATGFGGFGFGDAAKNPTTPQASQPATGQSVFGKPSTGPSAFGFGTTGTTNSAFGTFGKTPTSNGQQQQ